MRWLAGEAAAEDLSGQIRRAIEFYGPFLQDNYENADQRLADLEQLEGLLPENGWFGDYKLLQEVGWALWQWNVPIQPAKLEREPDALLQDFDTDGFWWQRTM
jgi:hypothetical protein